MLQTETVNNTIVVTIATANLDASNVKQFKSDITPIIEQASQVVFDLGQITFLDSSGLGALLSCLRTLNGKGGDLKLAGMNNQVRVLFELVRMHRIFDIFATREQAVQAFCD